MVRQPGGGQPEPGTRSELSGSARDVVQARDIHGDVHFHTPQAEDRLRPAQLPADVAGFVNRSRELDALTTALSADASLVVVVGTAGVGKTSVALRWAHRFAPQFPDGQLCVNLRGYDPGVPLTAAEALDGFLRALSVAPQAMPGDLDARAALYRSQVAGRRMLIVLDNASSVSQIRPLLPGTAGCVTLVTSRNRLSGLVARDGAQRLTLDTLSQPDAVTILNTFTNRTRGAEPADAYGELARLCARLPLALRIAAERVASRPMMSIDELIRDLRDESAVWHALTAEDDEEADAVRSVFAWSYRALPTDAKQLFRRLGLHPGPELSMAAVAVLGNISESAARRGLDTLVGTHLLEQTGPDRYQMHDLLRAYAADQAHVEETGEEQHAIVSRILAWYLYTAQAAVVRLGATDLPVRLPEPDPALPIQSFDTTADATTWLNTERANLLASVRRAATIDQLRTYGWQIPAVLRTHYMRHNLFEDWISASGTGLEAARADGNRWGEVELLDSLGIAHVASQELVTGISYHSAALELRRALGDHLGAAVSLNALGLAALRGRDLNRAQTYFVDAIAEFGRQGEAVWAAVARANLGEVQYELSDYAAADESTRAVLTVFQGHQDAQGEGNALRILAAVQREQGRTADSLESATAAVRIAIENANSMWEAFWLLELGASQHAAGHLDHALESFEQSAVLHQELGDQARQARALRGVGAVHRGSQRLDEAISADREAIDVLQYATDPWQLAQCLEELAAALSDAGQRTEAVESWHRALPLLGAFADPRAARLRARIASRLASP